MESVYDLYVKAASEGRRCNVDFKRNDMTVNGKYLIKGGTNCTDHSLLIDTLPIDVLYRDYKFSIPSEKSEKHKRNYFKALSVDELTDEQMINGKDRETAKAALEGAILCKKLNGDLKWKSEWGTWFYQSKDDPDFILLKDWLV